MRRGDRARTALRVLLALLAGACVAACGPREPPSEQNAALQQAPGEWLYINYWAVWCKPCIKEIPELNDFMRQHSDSVRVLAVNFDGERGQALREQAQRLGFEVPLLEDDPAGHFGYPRPQVLPTTVLIKPSGQVHRVLVGPQTRASLEQARSLSDLTDRSEGKPK